jgi:gamma-glutamylcyclotransferase (GGCT)/AIG2-like uncharacterized protein YtfP
LTAHETRIESDAIFPEDPPQRLFVYGSLMEGFFNYRKIFSGRILSRTPARVRGVLYHQIRKGYPAMIPGENWVLGEFLQLDSFHRLLAVSDSLENYREGAPDNEYERRLSPVELLPERTAALAYVYWYARNDLGAGGNPVEPVLTGDWRDYMTHLG